MRAALLALPGIGPWTVEYVAMRALRDPDALPAGDLVLRNALGGIGEAECAAEPRPGARSAPTPRCTCGPPSPPGLRLPRA